MVYEDRCAGRKINWAMTMEEKNPKTGTLVTVKVSFVITRSRIVPKAGVLGRVMSHTSWLEASSYKK